MKKLIALLCALTCIFSLTACGFDSRELTADEKSRREKIETNLASKTMSFLSGFLEDDAYEEFAGYNPEELEYMMDTRFQGDLRVDGYGLKTALESFHLAGKTTGKILEVTNIKATVSGTQIVVSADVRCEKKNATAELIFSNDLFLRLKGGALNPAAGFWEMMEKAALNTVIGMGTVFAVLILISLIIACFVFVPKLEAGCKKLEEGFKKLGAGFKNILSVFIGKKNATEGIDNAVAQIKQQEEILGEADNAQITDDTELVAVIAAAVAAYEGSVNTEGFVVRSIRRR